MDNELEKAFEDKFYCPARFAQEIEGLVQAQEEMNYIDAIVYFCELNSIDLESVPKLISTPLKEKPKSAAQDLTYLKRTSTAKIIFYWMTMMRTHFGVNQLPLICGRT